MVRHIVNVRCLEFQILGSLLGVSDADLVTIALFKTVYDRLLKRLGKRSVAFEPGQPSSKSLGTANIVPFRLVSSRRTRLSFLA
jgi:hypothetical protein